MTVSIFHWFREPNKPHNAANEYGEVALPFAPSVKMQNGETVVPQQYLDVVRTLENLEAVLARLSVPEHFQLFAGQEGPVLFLIVAIVGKENYPQTADLADQSKIVYGRRWLIEKTTPTSEVVQTALLAIKKIREHELREKVTLTINQGTNVTTPFNNHLDLPLFVGNADNFLAQHQISIIEQCKHIKLDGLTIQLKSEHLIADQMLLELELVGEADHFQDLRNTTVVLAITDPQEFPHALMQALISLSDRMIEESFAFEGCPRFSRRYDIYELARFSYETRNIKSDDPRFESAFKDMSYRVDAAKAPQISVNKLGEQQREFIRNYPSLGGYLPSE